METPNDARFNARDRSRTCCVPNTGFWGVAAMTEHKTYSGPYSEPETKLAPLEYMRRSEEVDDLEAECERFWASAPDGVVKAVILRAKLLGMLDRLENDKP